MTEIYRTTVTDAGPLAESFLTERMFVTFGENAPDALREFCFLVAPATSSAVITVGHQLVIDGAAFPITAVGDVAQRNLDSLGHVTITLDGADTPAMDGGIHALAGEELPRIAVGSILAIESP